MPTFLSESAPGAAARGQGVVMTMLPYLEILL